MRLTYRALNQNGEPTGDVFYNAMSIKTGDNIFPQTDKEKMALEKLADYEDADEQGRLVILPCSIGTECWRVNFDRRRHPIEPIRFDVGSYRVWGKTVFLTRAEAEAALKGETKDV